MNYSRAYRDTRRVIRARALSQIRKLNTVAKPRESREYARLNDKKEEQTRNTNPPPPPCLVPCFWFFFVFLPFSLSLLFPLAEKIIQSRACRAINAADVTNVGSFLAPLRQGHPLDPFRRFIAKDRTLAAGQHGRAPNTSYTLSNYTPFHPKSEAPKASSCNVFSGAGYFSPRRSAAIRSGGGGGGGGEGDNSSTDAVTRTRFLPMKRYRARRNGSHGNAKG